MSANALALALDQAQYDADAGPCLSAASQGSAQSLTDTVEETAFPAFRAGRRDESADRLRALTPSWSLD